MFVALRNIRAGEELTHGWATTDDDEYTRDRSERTRTRSRRCWLVACRIEFVNTLS